MLTGPPADGRYEAWREYEVESTEDLTIKGRVVETYRVRLTAASEGFDENDVYWLAPEIGIVKFQSDSADWMVADYSLTPRVVEGGVRTYCSDWTRLDVPPHLYDNNVWGKGPLTDYEQCLLARDVGGVTEYGWRWEWPRLSEAVGDLRHQVKAYPGVLYGHKPWHRASTTPDMPVRIADISELSVLYDVDLDAEGLYNLAFDIFLTSGAPPRPENASAEIMIWPHRSQESATDETMYAQPAEYRVGVVTFGGRDYEFYFPGRLRPVLRRGIAARGLRQPVRHHPVCRPRVASERRPGPDPVSRLPGGRGVHRAV